MFRFRDPFTGTIYEIGPRWQRTVSQWAADRIREHLNGDLKESADAVARFWRDTSYECLFPLRFGLRTAEGTLLCADLFPGVGPVSLDALAGQELRRRFLDGEALPPLLPAPAEGETSELLADRLLSRTALANVLLRQAGTPPEVLHAVRLALLTHPLLEHLEADLSRWPLALSLARFLNGTAGAVPEGLPETAAAVLTAIRDGTAPEEGRVWLVMAAAQRIKRYVFETPGLNEIRGASTLLDEWTEAGAETVSREVGPEVVLQAAASTLLFLAPAPEDGQGERWDRRLRRMLYERTCAAFPAAGVAEVPARTLLEDYRSAVGRVLGELARDRAEARVPRWEALPFEARCHLCRSRPAEGWTDLPGETEPVPLCRVCDTRREVGRQQRAAKLEQVLGWLGQDPSALGVRSEGWIAQTVGPAAEGGFIPDDARRPLLATVYGDGNNFGAVASRLTTLAMALQWTQRVKGASRAAAAVALARATQETAMERGWRPGGPPVLPRLPFQVLALGGDDLLLLAWAPVGLRFAREFLTLMDLEFRPGTGPRLTDPPIAFSLGVLMADHKTPVWRTVEFTERELLKWAKRAFRESGLAQGNVAMLLATTPEQIPADLKVHRQQMYLRRGESCDYCFTLRPLTAEELAFLLEKAVRLRDGGHVGPLHRLVSAMVTGAPAAGILHYVYQRARLEGRADNWLAELEQGPLPPSLTGLQYPVTEFQNRHPFGLAPAKRRRTYFSPLWDLLELVKVLE